ncbi:MAG: efflux transporter outer membrane subunit [Blastochloris viridis]|uniref:Efflux transporter outer membrane subunit n=1 Tax=Blastochloris viridis TaxID=1079 RepID=A0A6N4RBM4_BLAVI|nr:MAG: efflux transporter outer membrane subunit [Blastochloris viridis]
MTHFKNLTYATSLTAAWVLASCSLAPDIQDHAQVLPDQKNWALAQTSSVESSHLSWWENYNDATLTDLINRALARNTDILLAAARVDEARAALGLARAQRMPEISGQASGTRGNTDSYAVTGSDKPTNSVNVGGMFSYEVDLWGRLANSSKAAKAQLLAVEENARAVTLGIANQTASAYFSLVALNEQIAVTHKTIQTRQNAYKLEKKRLDKGDTDALSTSQVEAQLTAAQSRLPALERERDQYLTALSMLLGQSPAEVMASLPFGAMEREGSYVLPALPPLPEKSPENILTSRPDIRAAEHGITAANANIGVARAAYLPRISLSGLLGLQSAQMDDLFDGTTLWNTGINASVPLLDFGRARAQVDGAKAREKQAYLGYEKTVRTAFGEVKNALTVRQKSSEEYQALAKQASVLQNAVKLARQRFDAGYAGYIDVLDAERSLFDTQMSQIESKRRQLQASLDLYRALGE